MSATGKAWNLLRKVMISLAIIVGLVFCGLIALGLTVYTARHRERLLDIDPAREALAGQQPAALEPLAKRINQFSSLDEATRVAEDAGYHCETAEERMRAILPAKDSAPFDFICGRLDAQPSEDRALVASGAKAQPFWQFRRAAAGSDDEALILRLEPPVRLSNGGARLRIVRLTLRKPPGLLSRLLGKDSGIALVAAKGIEFAKVERFADLILEGLGGNPMAVCGSIITRTSCMEVREIRAKDGPGHWDGTPKATGQWGTLASQIEGFGLACTPFQSEDGHAPTGGEAALVLHCSTQSFSGQAQTVDMLVDTATSTPIALEFAIPGQKLRVPLRGEPPEHSKGAAVLLAFNEAGEARAIELAPNFQSGTVYRSIREFDTLTEASRQRVVSVNLKQVSEMIETPDALPIPQLQKLDTAATMLARFGASGVEPIRPSLLTAPPPLAAAVALAICAAEGQSAACLSPALVARPELSAILLAAHDEAQQATQGLDEEHPARERLRLLAAQLQAAGARTGKIGE